MLATGVVHEGMDRICSCLFVDPDGTMIFTPATVVPTHVLRLLARPDIVAAIRHGQEHPEEAVELELPTVPDVDWENPG